MKTKKYNKFDDANISNVKHMINNDIQSNKSSIFLPQDKTTKSTIKQSKFNIG